MIDLIDLILHLEITSRIAYAIREVHYYLLINIVLVLFLVFIICLFIIY